MHFMCLKVFLKHERQEEERLVTHYLWWLKKNAINSSMAYSLGYYFKFYIQRKPFHNNANWYEAFVYYVFLVEFI